MGCSAPSRRTRKKDMFEDKRREWKKLDFAVESWYMKLANLWNSSKPEWRNERIRELWLSGVGTDFGVECNPMHFLFNARFVRRKRFT